MLYFYTVLRSVAFSVDDKEGLLLRLQPDKQTTAYHVTAYLEAVWPTVRKLLHACSSVESF